MATYCSSLSHFTICACAAYRHLIKGVTLKLSVSANLHPKCDKHKNCEKESAGKVVLEKTISFPLISRNIRFPPTGLKVSRMLYSPEIFHLEKYVTDAKKELGKTIHM